jgi:hypothetical protein
MRSIKMGDLLVGMPGPVEEVTVEVSKDGKAGYILFTPRDSLAAPLKKEPVQAMIEYELGYMKVGIGAAYTIRWLSNEFWALAQSQWGFYPTSGYRRLIDGTVVHRTTEDFAEFQNALAHEEMIVPPAKVLEERGRGTEIHNVPDQGKLLQYGAWSQQPLDAGVLFPGTPLTIEYWMMITLQPVPGDEDPLTYHRILKEMWMQRLREISPGVSQSLAMLGDDFGVKVRYLGNNLRVWFVPNGSAQTGVTG